MAKKPIGGMTPKQVQVLGYLRDYIAKNVSAPHYDDIMKDLGYGAKSTVSKIIASLEADGYVKRVPGKIHAMEITAKGQGVRLPERRTP